MMLIVSLVFSFVLGLSKLGGSLRRLPFQVFALANDSLFHSLALLRKDIFQGDTLVRENLRLES